MTALADIAPGGAASMAITSAVLFVAVAAAVYLGYGPLKHLILRQEEQFGAVLGGALLMPVPPRMVTVLTGAAMALLAAVGAVLSGGGVGLLVGLAAGAALPYAALRVLRKRRLDRLENQLVTGIQTLSSGVRAGLNLVQSMEMIGRDGPIPLRQEFAHMLREYEYGIPLEDAMNNTAARIGSSDFRLLFSALQTHRERGGDLGDTLDRIADSIREIQRLEQRVRALTAQGRANARFLAVLVGVVLAILYLIEPDSVNRLFTDDVGKLILTAIVVLIIAGFLWIRKVVGIDI